MSNDDEIYINEINNKNIKINKIYHISDIHIHLQSKHIEYREVFKNLYSFLKKDLTKNSNDKSSKESVSIVVITGDILHSKTELTPECIELTREFMRKLSKIMPTFFIAGNHDLNVNNDERLDALTPIYNGISKSLNLYYLEKTGIYIYGDIVFSVASVRDYNIINRNEIDKLMKSNSKYKKRDYKVIGLYHGRVNGAILPNGSTIDGELNKKTGNAITPSSFSGYDFTLMGDIHHKQFVNKNETAGYSGSLIQQNHGETLNGHGVLVWNLDKKETEFKEISNNYGFVTLKLIKSKLFINNSNESQPIKNTKLNAKIKEIGDLGTKIKSYYGKEDVDRDVSIPKNIRLRLLLDHTPYSYVQDFVMNLKKHHNLIEYIYTDISDNNNDSYNINDINELRKTKETEKKISQNITNPQFQNKLLDEVLKKMDCNDTTIERIKKMNIALNEGIDKSDYSNQGQWAIKRLEFSNLYSYGLNNVINFNNCKGIVGIIADNHMGKSAILDIILYTLYDKFPRKGTLKDIINNRKNSFESKITFTIGEWDYIVSKSGRLTTAGKSTSKTDFYRIKGNVKEPLAEDNSPKTKLMILKYIGSYEDVIQTSFSLQNSGCNFVDAENTMRKKELERILKIDFVNELVKRGSSILQEERAVLKHLEQKCPREEAERTKKNIDELTVNLKELDINLTRIKKIIEDKNNKLSSLKEKIIPIDNNILELVEELEELEEDKGQDDKFVELELKINNYKEKLKDDGVKGIDNKKKWKKKWKEGKEKHKDWKNDRDTKLENIDKTIDDYYSNVENVNKIIINNDDKIKKLKKKLEKNKNNLKENEEKVSNLFNNNNNDELSIDEYIESQRTLMELKKEQLIIIKTNKLSSDFVNIINDNDGDKLKVNCEKVWNKVILGKKGKEMNNSNYVKLLNNINDMNIYNFLVNKNQQFSNDKEKINEIQNEINELNNNIIELRKIRKEIYALKNKSEIINNENECHEQEICYIESDNIKLREKEDKNKLIEEKIKLQKEEKKKILKKKDKKFNDLEQTYNRIEEYWEYCEDKDNYTKNNDVLIKKKQEIEKWNDSISKNKIIQAEIDLIEEEMEEINGEYEELNSKLNVAKARFVSNNTNLQTIIKDIKEMRSRENKCELCNIYIKALKQLPYILIDKIRPRLEKLVNELLCVVTNFQLKFEVENNKIDIYLDRPIYNGKLILLNNASGFEKFISSLSIRLALLNISLLPKPNFMAIDEGWTSFDVNNISNVRNIFDYLKSRYTFILSISHLQTIKSDCDMQISLIKDKEGYSKIKF